MCNPGVTANFCSERASTRALPPHTGSFEMSCGLPIGKVLFLQHISAGPLPKGSRTPNPRVRPHAGLRVRPRGHEGGSEAVNHGRQLRSWRRNLGGSGVANRAGGGTCGPPGSCGPDSPGGRGCRAPAAQARLTVSAARRSPRGGPAWAPRGRVRPRGLGELGGPPGPCPPPGRRHHRRSSADAQRVAEPILPTGHLADCRAGAARASRALCSSGLGRSSPAPPTQGKPRGRGPPGLPRLRERRRRRRL